ATRQRTADYRWVSGVGEEATILMLSEADCSDYMVNDIAPVFATAASPNFGLKLRSAMLDPVNNHRKQRGRPFKAGVSGNPFREAVAISAALPISKALKPVANFHSPFCYRLWVMGESGGS